MENKELEVYRNARIQTLCRHIENNRFEVVGKIGLALKDNHQPKNLLSPSVMNFLFARRSVEFLSKKNHLKQSIEVAKYIQKNELLPQVGSMLAKKYPHLPFVQRFVLAMNASFDEGRQNAPNGKVRHRYRENERE